MSRAARPLVAPAAAVNRAYLRLYQLKQTPICIYGGPTPKCPSTPPGGHKMAPLTAPTITIRPAYADDALALARLAVLDSAELPAEPLLLVEADGELRAALSLSDGSAIADPFAPTAELLALLRQHAARVHPG